MCNKCHKQHCCCPPAPCTDCVEPEVIVVRRGTVRNICNDLVDSLKALVINNKPKCRLQFGTPIIYLDTVTIVATDYNGPLEYSQDGNLWQSNATFTQQPNGKKKFFIREVDNNSCIAAGYATVTNGACTPNWQNVIPVVIDCLSGKKNYRQADGCGNFRWSPTNENCSECSPNWVNTTDPPSTSCIGGTVRNRQSDGCGNFRWFDTDVECEGCVIPTAEPVVAIAATCSSGVINADGQFIFTGIEDGDKYGYAFDGFYTGPPYSGATNIIDGEIHKTGLQGYDHPTYRTVRIFNGSDACYVDKIFTLPATVCCTSPSFTLSKVDPICNGGASLSNGKLVLSSVSNATKYQICENTLFTCFPNYVSVATPISGGGPFEILTNIGFVYNQAYKDFSVRLFNGSEGCYTDHFLRFNNPCYGECRLPQYQTVRVTAASCNGFIPNDNASFIVDGLTFINKIGYSLGAFYSGPNYASATSIPGATDFNYSFEGNEDDQEYTVRLFNGNDSCVTDIHFIIPGANCNNICDNPVFSLASISPTCTAGESNNNGSLTIQAHTDGTKYQVCVDSSFTCTPNYGSAIAIVGSGPIVIGSSIGFTSGEQYRDYTVRMYNGSVDCYKTETYRMMNPCYENNECLYPLFSTSYGVPATCSGSAPNNNASIYVTGVSGANKFGYSQGSTYSGPNFASASTLSGATVSVSGLAGDPNSTQYTVRLFSQTNTCYVDIVITVPGVNCDSGPGCCGLSINSITLTN